MLNCHSKSPLRPLALGLLSLIAAGSLLGAEPAKKSFDLPSDTAEKSLKRLAAQSGVEVLFATATAAGVRTTAVKGELSPLDAANRMLEATGLVAVQDARTGAITIQRDPAAEKNALSRVEKLIDPASAPAVKMEEIEITGSRLRGLVGEADFSPMVSFSRAEIEQTGLTTLGEISRLIPQAFSQGSYDGVGFGGQNQGQSTTSDGSTASALTQRTNINLRGLGAANTLILVNGRRMARSGNIRGSDGYDLTGIPVASIDRIEIVTDGASAIYGSDALGGVINIILRKNYSGSEVALSYENTFDSDTAVRTVALTHGITRGPLSLTLSATYQKRNAFAAVDRYFSATDDWRTLGGTSAPAGYTAGGFSVGAGVVNVASGTIPGVGSQYARIPDGATGTGLTAAQFIPTTVSADVGDRAKYVNLISPQFTRTLSFRGSYDLRSNLQIYANGGYNETRTHIEGMPVNFRNSIGQTATPIPANYPGNPFGVNVVLNKTFWELGNIQGQKFTTNSNLSFDTGLGGRILHGFFEDWRYNAGVALNRSGLRNENAFDPVLDATAYAAAIASQKLVLFYDSRTSQPNDINLLRSLLRPGNSVDRTDTTVWSVSADGPILKLPAGPLGLALGAERTTEEITTSQSIPDASNINLSLLGNFERTLDSVYGETRVPIISAAQHVPLINRLDLTGAIRYDSYSDASGDYSPRYGAQLRPFKWLLFRATRNYSFRAPGISALYRPVTDSTNANPTGFIDRQRNELVTGVIPTRIGGNLNLKPEHSTSDNIGVVFEVPFKLFKGLSFSVDANKVNYKDQIASLSTLQEWADIFPERLIRDATGTQPGRVIGIDTRSINLSRQILLTYDYQVSYQRATKWGNFTGRLTATEYRKLDSFRIPGATPVSSLYLRPTRITWQTYWSKGPYGAGVSGFYQENSWTSATYATTLFASAIEWNTQVSYDFGWQARQRALTSTVVERPWRQRLLEGTKLAVTVNNIFDREPPHRQGNAGFGVTDPRMARYALTLRREF
jgi:iron complex outermembrane receptor protein